MSLSKDRTAALRSAVIRAIAEQQLSVSEVAAEQKVSSQTVYNCIRGLEQEGQILLKKDGKRNHYELSSEVKQISLSVGAFDEDMVWRRELKTFFSSLPKIAFDNLAFACLEMLNNTYEHSEGSTVKVTARKTAYSASLVIADDGVGIFSKIAAALDLPEKSFSILELAKGKFTTDPNSHTGEGIFFSSKVVDRFAILSDDLIFYSGAEKEYPQLDTASTPKSGTTVMMEIFNHHTERSSEVFDRFKVDPETYGFNRTIVPVRLLEYGEEQPQVISRSQARRLMARFDRFENIILDFSGIEEIGQGFADELFRVFVTNHPKTTLTPIHCEENVERMIRWVQGTL